MNRPLSVLRVDQAAILEEYRAERTAKETGATLPRPGTTAVAGFGRVSSVVTSDATYGPHLLVVRQIWTGTPPVMADSAATAIRCYPTPNRAVTDFAVNEKVRMSAAHGAMVVEKLT